MTAYSWWEGRKEVAMNKRALTAPPYRPGPLSTHPPAQQYPWGLRWHSGAAPDRTGLTGQRAAQGVHMSSRTHNVQLQTAGPAAAGPNRCPPEDLPVHLYSQKEKGCSSLKICLLIPTLKQLFSLFIYPLFPRVEAHILTLLLTKEGIYKKLEGRCLHPSISLPQEYSAVWCQSFHLNFQSLTSVCLYPLIPVLLTPRSSGLLASHLFSIIVNFGTSSLSLQ